MTDNNTTRSAMLTVKLLPSRLDEFRIAATLRGTTMSALVQQFITQVVREEMAAVPQAFRRRSSPLDKPGLIDLLDQSDMNNN